MDKNADQQNNVWLNIISQTSHYFINKMATLRGKQGKLKEIIPVLISNYQLNFEKNIESGEVKKRYLDTIDCIINLDEQIGPMIELIHLLYAYCEPLRTDIALCEPLSVQQSIDDFLRASSFDNDKQRKLIKFEKGHDFYIKMSPIFMNALLNNFLMMALKNLCQSSEDFIKIWLSENEEQHVLHFKYRNALPDGKQYNVFDNGLLQQEDKLVPALGFCRLAVLHAGGDIICDVVEEKHVYFKVVFPKNNQR